MTADHLVASAEPPHRERAHLCDPLEITVQVDDAEVVVKRGLRYEQVGDRRPVPHSVMVGKVPLEPQGAFEYVGGGCDSLEGACRSPLHSPSFSTLLVVRSG